ncbi:unnamed protein product [Brassica oleracea]
MDPRLQQAAESGSINALYALIDEDPYILENIDAVPFINTPLHAVRLLLECRLVERNKVNGDGLTFLDILRNLENAGVWDLDLKQVVLKTGCKEAASVPKPKAVSQPFKSRFTRGTHRSTFANRLRSNTSEEVRGALLIVFTLIITATYQTALQPPGGGQQSKDPHSSTNDLQIKHAFLLFLWVFNTIGFYCALFNISCLLPRKPRLNAWFMSVETYLGVCYALAVAENSPDPVFFCTMTCAILLLYFIYIGWLGLVGRQIYRTVARKSFSYHIESSLFLISHIFLLMDPRLQHAAETGSINDFYALVDENPYILDNINAVPFVNTPFHVAAASGNIPFSTEMLNLKPSFAAKLNTSGYSPLHLAVEKDHRDFVVNQSFNFITWLLGIDPKLFRVKGREGITPFHLIVVRGDANLVAECLMSSPECIQDVTVNGHNALHLALTNGRFETLQVLTGWIQRMSQRDSASTESDILNKKDVSHNTPLHLAAYKEDHQAWFLISFKCQLVKPNEVNGDGLTFLDILRHQGQSRDLELEQAVFKTRCKEATSLPKLGKTTSDQFKTPITFWSYCSTGIKRLKSDTSEEGRAVFLIICTLIITSTYQTALQPPGGLRQSEDGGSAAVMKQTFFIVLWVSNTIGFCCALLYTFCLLPVSSLFTTWFFWIGASLGVSYALAMAVISPHPVLFICAAFALYLLFPLYLFMEIFIALRLSHLKATVSRMFVTLLKQRPSKA